MSEQQHGSSRPMGTGPGVFGHYGPVVRIFTAAGEFVFSYSDEERAARVVTILRERLQGDSPAAARLRADFTWPLMMSFIGECFPAEIPLRSWKGGSPGFDDEEQEDDES